MHSVIRGALLYLFSQLFIRIRAKWFEACLLFIFSKLVYFHSCHFYPAKPNSELQNVILVPSYLHISTICRFTLAIHRVPIWQTFVPKNLKEDISLISNHSMIFVSIWIFSFEETQSTAMRRKNTYYMYLNFLCCAIHVTWTCLYIYIYMWWIWNWKHFYHQRRF